jgi:hypothetical protein
LKHVSWSTRLQQNAPDLSGEALYIHIVVVSVDLYFLDPSINELEDDDLVIKYLDDLEKLFNALPKDVNPQQRDQAWAIVFEGIVSINYLAQEMKIESNQALQHTAVLELAFFTERSTVSR